eukprot:TRINITY_DN1808_c0_g2_i14.p1 TRINITY_DN1808_c0_g2~~TRINITY_DN1808_c0_g2_i14.p1  ORF type:complete len:402 (+),score=68.30 TRINITY_DN1808_c0_g2_i14:53-1258(+)
MGSFGSKIERYRSCAEVIHPHTTCDKFWLLAGQAAFLNAVKIYGPLFLWSALMQSRFKPSPKALLTKTVPAILRSCLFLSCVAGLFPLFMCIWSRRGFLLSHFGWLSMAWLAGIIGILIEKGNRRIELTVYVANQALEVLYRMLMNRGILPQIERGSEIVFALSFAVLHSFYKHHPQHITNSASNVMKVTVGIEDSPDRVERFVSRFYFWYKNKFSGTTLVPRWIFSKDWRDVQQSGLGDKNDDEVCWTLWFVGGRFGLVAVVEAAVVMMVMMVVIVAGYSTCGGSGGSSGSDGGDGGGGFFGQMTNSNQLKKKKQKTRLCSHPSGCKSYSVIGALKGFSLGLAIRFTFSLLPALVKTRKLLTLVLWKKSQFSQIWGIPGSDGWWYTNDELSPENPTQNRG